MMNLKDTQAKYILQAIQEKLVIVRNAQTECKDTDEVFAVTPEQFVKDLETYINSGIFANSLDFKYKITGQEFLHVEVGYLSSYCQNEITVTLQLCDGVLMEQVDELLKKTIFH